ncbi:2-phosphosulfolactate phosphatase [Paenibacillus oralis]|uniref:Probable 2-phosphosulfolactate phosphatase n=1 Tax=Paenibacillus oralis TaxID=2490856 RepID=A0A3P3UBM6_9BACL|nr:2-phosphosulfolactate phosphatase [Paenibacillus oralis]
MNIEIMQGDGRTPAASDINVVIDVIRAFTVAHLAFIHGVKGIFLAATLEEAFCLKKEMRDLLLAGEEKGLLIDGFDLDNSPARIGRADLQGKFLVQKTTNGVKAALHALDAKLVLVTGFSNARTTAEYIKRNWLKSNPAIGVNIIASHPTGDDDLACAEYISGMLRETFAPSAEETRLRILSSEAARKFYDPGKPEFLPADMEFCSTELPSDFVMAVNRRKGIPFVEKVIV